MEINDEMIKRAAAAIREEIDCLLGDYIGDYINDDIERTPEEQLAADAKAYAFSQLRDMWTASAAASEERLEGAAKAALQAALTHS